VSELSFFIDYSRCIGCQACVQACQECDTHRGRSMIHLETIRRRETVQAAPQVCMHCENPICARVCPADAIKKTPEGVVQSSLKPRCIGCSNCVLSCPFGVPKYYAEIDQMMKCDMCYDRTSVGKRPMCATVCPSQALAYTTREEIERTRRGVPINEWTFAGERVRTKVYVMVPPEIERIDVDLLQIDGDASPAFSELPAAPGGDPYAFCDVAGMVLAGSGD
jgi:Fe-S-cluster-containing dehydrogenase component